MTYIGIIEWKPPRHSVTEHTIVASSDDSAIQHFKDVAREGHGVLVCVHAVVPIYTRPLGL